MTFTKYLCIFIAFFVVFAIVGFNERKKQWDDPDWLAISQTKHLALTQKNDQIVIEARLNAETPVWFLDVESNSVALVDPTAPFRKTKGLTQYIQVNPKALSVLIVATAATNFTLGAALKTVKKPKNLKTIVIAGLGTATGYTVGNYAASLFDPKPDDPAVLKKLEDPKFRLKIERVAFLALLVEKHDGISWALRTAGKEEVKRNGLVGSEQLNKVIALNDLFEKTMENMRDLDHDLNKNDFRIFSIPAQLAL